VQCRCAVPSDPHEADLCAKGWANQGVVTAIGDSCYFGDMGLFFNVKRTAMAKAGTMCLV
jgi:hypothetical protein